MLCHEDSGVGTMSQMGRLAVLIFATVAAGGCVTLPVRVVEYRSGHSASVVKAPLTRMYTLYAQPHQRIESTTVSLGQPIGFTRSGGALQAVGGDERIPLCEGNYVWLLEFGPDPPPAGDIAMECLMGAAVLAVMVPLEALAAIARSPSQLQGLRLP